MIIPFSTDAPIYHWPIATIGLIVVNVALLFVSPQAAEAGYALDLGHGLHPVQWLTHNYLHGGIMHLVGNMIFLWSFGIVVEGKVGALAFLGIYNLIGVCHGASVQLVSLRMEPTFAVGASAVIFGLLAICMIWAPKNELQCFVFFSFGFRIYTGIWDIPILTFAALDIGYEFVTLAFSGLTGLGMVISATGHISGAIWGTIVGIALLKLGWVDCENWDLFAVWGGRQGKKKGDVKLSRSQPVLFHKEGREKEEKSTGGTWEKSPEVRAGEAMKKIKRQVEAGEAEAARETYRKALANPEFQPPEAMLLGWIKGLHANKAFKESIPFLRDAVRRFPNKAPRVRLKLAQILVQEQRPTQALRELEAIPEGALPESLEGPRRQLTGQALRMQDEGVLELEGDE